MDLRIIKKYPNRRLYDTAISSYITLEDVKRLVIEQIPLQVVDAKSQKDITHTTLLQIIIEQEENGPALFSTNSLKQMIRVYGSAVKATEAFSEVAQKNLSQWQQFQQEWLNSWSSIQETVE